MSYRFTRNIILKSFTFLTFNYTLDKNSKDRKETFEYL